MIILAILIRSLRLELEEIEDYLFQLQQRRRDREHQQQMAAFRKGQAVHDRKHQQQIVALRRHLLQQHLLHQRRRDRDHQQQMASLREERTRLKRIDHNENYQSIDVLQYTRKYKR